MSCREHEDREKSMHTQQKRYLAILSGLLLFGLVLIGDALCYFPYVQLVDLFFSWVRFGFSACSALLFLAVGSLVWYYARNRLTAGVSFAFCLALMVTFAVETGAAANDPLPTAISKVTSPLGLALFAVLLLLFPRNAFARREGRQRRVVFGYLVLIVVAVAIIIPSHLPLFLAVARQPWRPLPLYDAAGHPIYYTWQFWHYPIWLDPLGYACEGFLLLGVLCTIMLSYRRTTLVRERQQLRLFVSGVLLAFSPVFLLTVLPLTLQLPSHYVVDGQISASLVSLLPLALGYSVLRYQMLVFEASIRRAVLWIIGAGSLALLAYLVFVFTGALYVFNGMLAESIAVGCIIVLEPWVWRAAQWATESIFSPETLHYHRVLYDTDGLLSLLPEEVSDLASLAQTMTALAMEALGAQTGCLFVLDEERGVYALLPRPSGKDQEERLWLQLLARALRDEKGAAFTDTGQVIAADSSLVKRLSTTKRPLFLNEVLPGEEVSRPVSYRTFTAEEAGNEPLLVPVRAHGAIIAVLALDGRTDGQSYAGPDFEILDQLLQRFATVLESARREAQDRQRLHILQTLFHSDARALNEQATTQNVAQTYAQMAANALNCHAEIWLLPHHNGLLERIVSVGEGEPLLSANILKTSPIDDWRPYFFEANEQNEWYRMASLQLPTAVQPPRVPFAWLPLKHDEGRHVGVLVLTFTHPHHFSEEEKLVLEMFITHCTAALEYAQMMTELRILSTADDMDRTHSHWLASVCMFLQETQDYLSQLLAAILNVSADEGMLAVNKSDTYKLTNEDILQQYGSCQSPLFQIAQFIKRKEADPISVQPGDLLSVRHNSPSGYCEERQSTQVQHDTMILVLEPSPSLQTLLFDMLTVAGFCPEAVGSGQELLHWMRRATSQGRFPTCFLVDGDALEMELAVAQRSAKEHWGDDRPFPPFIVLTSHPERVQQTATTVLGKPFRLSLLLDAVERAADRAGEAPGNLPI